MIPFSVIWKQKIRYRNLSDTIFGFADGAFILHKKKRTDKEAVMEVVGRDQQDQEITLEFDMEFCRWNFIKSETELWKPKPDPVLEQIAGLFTEEVKEWQGNIIRVIGFVTGD